MKFWVVGGTMLLLGSVFFAVTINPATASTNKTTTRTTTKPTSKLHVAVISGTHALPKVTTGRSDLARYGDDRHVIAMRGTIGVHGTLGHSSLLRTAFSRHSLSKGGKERLAGRGDYGGISCVPFARAASGIDLKGNAANWWDAASGVYARGDVPESGSVLNFRATGHMRLGHVAVVTQVVNTRQVQIDHANWGDSRGGVSRGIAVIDVSEANDWSEVRVALGHGGEFGSVYPTYGFIYDRPDHAPHTIMASAPSRNAAFDEVAEAPAVSSTYIDAPSHSIR